MQGCLPVCHFPSTDTSPAAGYLFTCQSRPPPRHGGDRKATRHRRFFVALLLYDLIHEYTLYDVAQKYGVTRAGRYGRGSGYCWASFEPTHHLLGQPTPN